MAIGGWDIVNIAKSVPFTKNTGGSHFTGGNNARPISSAYTLKRLLHL